MTIRPRRGFVASLSVLLTSVAALAEEPPRPTVIDNPHHLIELAPLLRIPAIRREMNFTERQIIDLETIEAQAKQESENYKLRTLSSDNQDQRREAYLQWRSEQLTLSFQGDSLFSPDQLSRIKQLASQYVTRFPSNGFGLLSQDMQQHLHLTTEQSATIRQKSAVIEQRLKAREAELKLELEKFRTSLRAELIESLDPDQRDKLKLLWGELTPINP